MARFWLRLGPHRPRQPDNQQGSREDGNLVAHVHHSFQNTTWNSSLSTPPRFLPSNAFPILRAILMILPAFRRRCSGTRFDERENRHPMPIEFLTQHAMLAGMTTSKPTRRWFQYSLRTMLVFVTLSAIAFRWLGVKIQQAKRERQIAEAIERLGGQVWGTNPSGPAWLPGLVGEKFLFSHASYVNLRGSRTDINSILDHVRGLTQVEGLGLDSGQVKDIDLQRFKELTQLRQLDIRGSSTNPDTDEKIRKLPQVLPNCQVFLNGPSGLITRP